MKTNIRTKKGSRFDERIVKYLDEQTELLKRHKMSAQICINFPKRKKVTLLSKLSIWFLKRQGGVLDTRFFDLKK